MDIAVPEGALHPKNVVMAHMQMEVTFTAHLVLLALIIQRKELAHAQNAQLGMHVKILFLFLLCVGLGFILQNMP